MPDVRLAAIGDELVRIHAELRRQLAAVRAGVHTGGVDLREHCLAFCDALHAHHINEDRAFPRYPQLAPVVDQLRREHVVVAGHLRRLRELLDAGGDVSADIEQLAGELEAHFAYEEDAIRQ